MFTATIGHACSSCSSTSRPLSSVCLVNGMFTNVRLNACSPDDGERNGGGPVVTGNRQFGGNPLGRGHEGARCRRIGLADEKRRSRVAALADGLIDRDAADKRHAEILRHPLSAALSEDVRLMLAIRADEVAHVLDNTERRD